MSPPDSGKSIATLADFKDRIGEHLRESNVSGRPLFLHEDGKTQAVVLSPAAFNRLLDQAELATSLQMIDESAEQIRVGSTSSAKAGLRDLARRLDLSLDR